MRDLSISPNGEFLAAAGWGGVSLYTIEELGINKTPEEALHLGYAAYDVSWSSDGSRIAIATNDGVIVIWNLETQESELSIQAAPVWAPLIVDGVLQVIWFPDGNSLLARTNYSTAVWDGETGEMLYDLRGVPGHICGIALSPDGAIIAAGGARVRLWDSLTGELLDTLENKDGACSIDWSPDGTTLALQADRNVMVLWNAPGDDEEGTAIFIEEDAYYADDLTWSPDGELLAFRLAPDGPTIILDVQTSSELCRIEDYEISSMVWSQDGRFLIAGSENGTVTFWEIIR